MKIASIIAFVCAGMVSSQNLYKDGDVKALCGFCASDVACDQESGECPDGCAPGYRGKDCQEPECNVDCGTGGKCIAPDQCVCGYLHAQGDDNGCYSLRADGIKGSVIALCVIITAISFCGGLQNYLTKKQN